MKNLPRINVTAGILRQGDQVLLAQRPEEKYDGLWEFPGGKMESGETPEACLQRELKEELAIDCLVGELLCTTEWSREGKVIVLHTYKILDFTGIPLPLVHSDLKWVDIKKLSKEDVLPADRPVVDRLISSIDSV